MRLAAYAYRGRPVRAPTHAESSWLWPRSTVNASRLQGTSKTYQPVPKPTPALGRLHETVRRLSGGMLRQVLGSTMHCVAGDGVGILMGAVAASVMHLMGMLDVALEYLLGFGFGWTIFQALFMRGGAGRAYTAALRDTFLPEWLSMNVRMAGMVPTMMVAMMRLPYTHDAAGSTFWFVMSMARLV